MWLHADATSEIVSKGREAGTWRAMLDLAESVNKDLGPDTCAYSEKEIIKALKKQKPVRYRVSMRDDGVAHLGLSSEDDDLHKPFTLDWEQEYGRGSGSDYHADYHE
jgi:hypothetical protein